MLRRTTAVMALAISLMAGGVAGCGGPGTPPAEPTEPGEAVEEAQTTEAAQDMDGMEGTEAKEGMGSAEATETSDTDVAKDQPATDLETELREALARVPSFVSVTITEHGKATLSGAGAGAKSDSMEGTSLYKFDEGDGTLKTSMEADASGTEVAYYTLGDDVVFVFDGVAYSGTADQFGLVQAEGVEPYFTNAIGDLDAMVDAAEDVTKEQMDANTVYTLSLNVDRFVEGDEALSMMARYGAALEGVRATIGFDADGRIVSLTRTLEFADHTASTELTFSDFDATAVDAMPEATATYEDLQSDMQANHAEPPRPGGQGGPGGLGGPGGQGGPGGPGGMRGPGGPGGM